MANIVNQEVVEIISWILPYQHLRCWDTAAVMMGPSMYVVGTVSYIDKARKTVTICQYLGGYYFQEVTVPTCIIVVGGQYTDPTDLNMLDEKGEDNPGEIPWIISMPLPDPPTEHQRRTKSQKVDPAQGRDPN